MLNKEAISIIQGISEVNNQAIISWPTTTITNVIKDVNGIVNFDKVCEEFDEFGIWDLGSFLGSLSILENPTISMKDNIITASDEYSNINYVTSSPNILGDSVCDPRIVSSTLAIESSVEVEINTDTIARIKKGVSLFKNLKDLAFIKKDGDFCVKTTNKESFNSSKNAYTLYLQTTKNLGENFEITIPAENFLLIPTMDYTMKVHQKDGRYRISMSNEIFSFALSIM